MREIIELIRKHQKISRILQCESPYFHHWREPNMTVSCMSWRDRPSGIWAYVEVCDLSLLYMIKNNNHIYLFIY